MLDAGQTAAPLLSRAQALARRNESGCEASPLGAGGTRRSGLRPRSSRSRARKTALREPGLGSPTAGGVSMNVMRTAREPATSIKLWRLSPSSRSAIVTKSVSRCAPRARRSREHERLTLGQVHPNEHAKRDRKATGEDQREPGEERVSKASAHKPPDHGMSSRYRQPMVLIMCRIGSSGLRVCARGAPSPTPSDRTCAQGSVASSPWLHSSSRPRRGWYQAWQVSASKEQPEPSDRSVSFSSAAWRMRRWLG